MEKSFKVRMFSDTFFPSHEPLVILYLVLYLVLPFSGVEVGQSESSRESASLNSVCQTTANL